MKLARVVRISFVVVLFGFFIYYICIITPEGHLEKLYMKENYSGVIVNMYVDRKNHNSQVIYLGNGRRVLFPRASYNLFDSIHLGSYIYKEKGTLEAFVVFDDSTKLRIPYTLSE